MVSAIASRSAPLSRAAVDDVEHPLRWRRAVERAVPRGGDDDLHRSAAVVGDRDDVSDLRGRPPRWTSDVGAAVAVGGRHHVLDGVQACGDRALGTVRAGHQRGELHAGNLCSSAASSAASASAGTFDGETNAVASISRTPVATMASSISSLADNGIGSSICSPSRSETSRMSTWSGSSVIARPPPAARPARHRSCRAGRGTPRRCAGPAGPNRRCGWCPAFPRAPAPRRVP